MKPTRREFLLTTTAAMCAISLSGAPSSMFEAPREIAALPTLLDGDPYTAHVDEHGLGGRSWDAAYEHALRFRATPEHRDQYVLGLEL